MCWVFIPSSIVVIAEYFPYLDVSYCIEEYSCLAINVEPYAGEIRRHVFFAVINSANKSGEIRWFLGYDYKRSFTARGI